jgi:hypothetical protein
VTLFDDANTNGVVDGGETLATGTGAAFATGIDVSLVGDGVHHVKAIQTDAAGNVSSASTALDITIDTTLNTTTFEVDRIIAAGELNSASFTVGALDGDATATASFTDGANTVGPVAAVTGGNSVDLASATPTGIGNGAVLTSTLTITDAAGNVQTVNGNRSDVNTTDTLTMSVNQFQGWGPSQMGGFLHNIVVGGGASLQALTVPEIQAMDTAGVERIDSISDALRLTAAQFSALGSVDLTAADVVTIRYTAAALDAALDFTNLAAANVDKIDSTDELVLDVASYEALRDGNSLIAKNSITLADTNSAITGGLSLAEFGGLAASGVDQIRGTDFLSLSLDQFNALGTTKVTADTDLTVQGTGGNDTIGFVRQTLDSGDTVNGYGGVDTMSLKGDYSGGVNLQGVSGIERLNLSAGFDYSLTTGNGTVAAGESLLVNGAGLGAGDSLIFDASAETDGSFNIRGGSGPNTITGGWLADSITAGSGLDTIKYTDARESRSMAFGSGYDTVSGFDGSSDKFDVDALTGGGVSGVTVQNATLAKATLNTNLETVFGTGGASELGLNAAAVVTGGAGGNLVGQTFLLVNVDGVAGYQGGSDLLVKVNGSNLGSINSGTFS